MRRALVDMLADRIVACATSHRSAWTLWRPAPGERSAARAAATIAAERLRELGIFIVRPGAVLPADAVHRHCVLFCDDVEDRRQISQWVSHLARVSPRAHLVVDLTDHVPVGEGARDLRVRADVEASTIAGIHSLVDHLELDRAEARVRARIVQSALDAADVPAGIRACDLAIRFWQGRFDRPAGSVCDPDVHVRGWIGVHAWARGDPIALQDAVTRVASIPDGSGATFWRGVLGTLLDPGAGAITREAVEGWVAGAPGELRGLAYAIAGEAVLATGHSDGMSAFLRVSQGTPLTKAVADWFRARVPGSGREGALAAIRRTGAYGVMRLGGGRVSMQWLHVMPALLEIVRDAEDDVAAMTSACQWLVRHGGASKAVIVDGPGQQWLAGEGWQRAEWVRKLAPGARTATTIAGVADDAGMRCAPVRYRGEAIGHVIAAPDPGAGTTLQPAVDAVAALLAPAVRARLDAMAVARRPREALVPELIGRSPAIASIRDEIVKAAAVPFPVLIEGESGTGKELVARAIHRLSPRRDRRYCAVNCAAISDELVEAELFGHARGAFTGAIAPRAGLFEDAHAGTLFLDEVGELSLRAQAKLLRAVQEREVRRVGENAARTVDVRLVAATNVGLQDAVGAGRFRADLHFRLAVIRITLPPLRDRLEDIPILVDAFWRQVTLATSTRARLAPDALAGLTRHTWPGNVRELQNAIAALVMIAPDRGRVSARHVRQVLGAPAADAPWTSLTAARRTFEQRTIATALARHAGRRAAAARELGLSRQGLAKAIKRLGLSAVSERASGAA